MEGDAFFPDGGAGKGSPSFELERASPTPLEGGNRFKKDLPLPVIPCKQAWGVLIDEELGAEQSGGLG